MKRSLVSAVAVFIVTALIGTALNARAEAAQTCGAPADDASIYWVQ